MKIRAYKDTDRDGLLPILREAIASADSYPYDPASDDDALFKIWCAPNHRVYVGMCDAQIAGTFYIRPNQPCLGAHICNAGFMVSMDFRGRGIGTDLANYALKEAKSLGYRAMQFNLVVADNSASIRLWKNFGFTMIGTIPEAFHHPQKGFIDAHIMYRTL